MTKVYETFAKTNDISAEEVAEKMVAFKKELQSQIIISAIAMEELSE